MRTCSLFGLFFAAGVGFGAPAHALDPSLTPSEALRSGYAAYKSGDTETAIEALNFAAKNGHAAAMWKLGRMYATGDGVTEDDAKALEFFSKVANDYADGNPRGADAPFVASAFVNLGSYYRKGLPGTLDADPVRARRYFAYAASYFGDPDAQYQLATMFLSGEGGDQDARQAVRWFKLAARKGHAAAQAELGQLFYEGTGVERSIVKGLMWLTIARLNGHGDPVIQAQHEQAFSTADEKERKTATALAEDWIAKSQSRN